MQLTIEHLNPYLPYGLKVQYEGIINGAELAEHKKQKPLSMDTHAINKWFDEMPAEKIGLKIAKVKAVKFFNQYHKIHVGKNYIHSKTCYLHNIRPILRPLSDLTKEINHDKQCFVPLDTLDMDFLQFEYFHSNGCISLNRITYLDAVRLFSWHFDVFGLIENNLAVSINDLEP
jgi:hypothetical protein